MHFSICCAYSSCCSACMNDYIVTSLHSLDRGCQQQHGVHPYDNSTVLRRMHSRATLYSHLPSYHKAKICEGIRVVSERMLLVRR